MSNIIQFLKVEPNAKLPSYMTEGAACFDFYAINDEVVAPKCAVTFQTGLCCEIPEGKVMLIFSRSGHGFKYGVRLGNVVGVIDSDYRGEIGIRLHNDGSVPFEVKAGDRIAQGMITDAPQYEIMEATSLSQTARGSGGMGSTGA